MPYCWTASGTRSGRQALASIIARHEVQGWICICSYRHTHSHVGLPVRPIFHTPSMHTMKVSGRQQVVPRRSSRWPQRAPD